jgi:hypothetical protein
MNEDRKEIIIIYIHNLNFTNMKKFLICAIAAVAIGAMESRDHSKNGASPKSQMSKRNCAFFNL